MGFCFFALAFLPLLFCVWWELLLGVPPRRIYGRKRLAERRRKHLHGMGYIKLVCVYVFCVGCRAEV